MRLYGYDDAKAGKLKWEKSAPRDGGGPGPEPDQNVLRAVVRVRWRQFSPGPRGQTITVYHVATERRYPTEQTAEQPADRQETTHSYTYYTNTNAVEFETVNYPAVPSGAYAQGGQNGSGTGTQAIYHYFSSVSNSYDGQHYVDWTKNEDGTYTYAQRGTDYQNWGQLVTVAVDADTASPYVSGFPGGANWPARTGNGVALNLMTWYDYYNDSNNHNLGQLKSVWSPGGPKKLYAHMSVKVTDTGHDSTTALATLVADLDPANNQHYDYTPTQIAVTDLAGRTLVSAEGASGSRADGNLANDWVASGTVDDNFTAFIHDNGVLTNRTVYAYNNTGDLASVTRWTTAGDTNAQKYTTYYTYTATGLRETVKESDGTVTFTKYDSSNLGRPVATWVGTDATLASQTDPTGGGAPTT